MNDQKAQPQRRAGDGTLIVHSVFLTIQGEGPFAGEPAVFVRLSDCNLECPMCDTDYTSVREKLTVRSLYDRIVAVGDRGEPSPRGRLVVLTGGEPFRQEVGPLVSYLAKHGFRVQVETNGTLFVPGPWSDHAVTIVVSPKVPKVNEKTASYARAYKYVAGADDLDPDDGLPRGVLGAWHGKPVARPPRGFSGQVFLQPTDAKNEDVNRKNRDAVLESCLRHGYTMSLQLHKIIGVD